MLRICLFAASLIVLPLAAADAGCLTGAVVGGVAGHVAGHHGLLGAGAGCVAGHEMSKHSAAKVPQPSSPPSSSGASPAGSGQTSGQ